jgi:hypothetical protein
VRYLRRRAGAQRDRIAGGALVMNDLHSSLSALFAELVDGPPGNAAYMLNKGDLGLLRSVDRLPAEAASRAPVPGAATIAAHVDHVCYGLELMNRWGDGEANPWDGADWTASWRRTTVTDTEWTELRERLRQATRRWHENLQTPRTLSALELNGVISSIAHLAYHLGAIRQIDRSIQGPKDS